MLYVTYLHVELPLDSNDSRPYIENGSSGRCGVKNIFSRLLGILLIVGPLTLVSCGNNNGTEVSKAKPVAPEI